MEIQIPLLLGYYSIKTIFPDCQNQVKQALNVYSNLPGVKAPTDLARYEVSPPTFFVSLLAFCKINLIFRQKGPQFTDKIGVNV